MTERVWTCDHCGFQFTTSQRTGRLPRRCEDCKQASAQPVPRKSRPRPEPELSYLLARECTDLRCAMQHALGALVMGRPAEARAALEKVLGVPLP